MLGSTLIVNGKKGRTDGLRDGKPDTYMVRQKNKEDPHP